MAPYDKILHAIAEAVRAVCGTDTPGVEEVRDLAMACKRLNDQLKKDSRQLERAEAELSRLRYYRCDEPGCVRGSYHRGCHHFRKEKKMKEEKLMWRDESNGLSTLFTLYKGAKLLGIVRLQMGDTQWEVLRPSLDASKSYYATLRRAQNAVMRELRLKGVLEGCSGKKAAPVERKQKFNTSGASQGQKPGAR